VSKRRPKAKAAAAEPVPPATPAVPPVLPVPTDIIVKVMRLAHGGEITPAYQTDVAAGFDLAAALEFDAPLTIAPGAHAAVPTGLVFEIPAGYEMQVRPRSGLAARHGLTLLNAPGTVDSDYRGEVKVLLVNLGAEPVTLKRGDRIAQGIIAPVVHAHLVIVSEVSGSGRGAGGFGSTGIAAKIPVPAAKVRPSGHRRPAARKPT
jgi:dUTP pyrophosphatase